MPLTKEQESAYEIIKASFNKKHGDGTLRILGGTEVSSIPRFSSGIPSLDEAMGGGYPIGRFIEIYGPASAGKSTITLHAIAELQKAGKLVALIDAEHTFDINYAKTLGVDPTMLIINQPSTAEEALDIVDTLCDSGLVSLIVVDSVAALVPKAELEGEMSDHNMGGISRLMSKICRKVTASSARNGVTIFWVNQIRMKIGLVFGSPEVTTGGGALAFYSSVRLDIRRKGTVKADDEAVANETEVKVVKNKTAPPYKVANFEIQFGLGVNKLLDVMRIAVDKGLIEKTGSWYSYNGMKIGQGEKNATAYLADNVEVLEKIKADIFKRPEVDNGLSTRNLNLPGNTQR